MIRTTRFSLEPHDGPYESWGSRSQLLLDGVRCGVQIAGFELLHQFETPDGYLFVSDYQCPFEEATCFTLISHAFKPISRSSFGAPYASCLLEELAVDDDGSIVFRLFCIGAFRLTIRDWGIPYLWSRLKFERLDDGKAAAEHCGTQETALDAQTKAESKPIQKFS